MTKKGMKTIAQIAAGIIGGVEYVSPWWRGDEHVADLGIIPTKETMTL